MEFLLVNAIIILLSTSAIHTDTDSARLSQEGTVHDRSGTVSYQNILLFWLLCSCAQKIQSVFYHVAPTKDTIYWLVKQSV